MDNPLPILFYKEAGSSGTTQITICIPVMYILVKVLHGLNFWTLQTNIQTIWIF